MWEKILCIIKYILNKGEIKCIYSSFQWMEWNAQWQLKRIWEFEHLVESLSQNYLCKQ